MTFHNIIDTLLSWSLKILCYLGHLKSLCDDVDVWIHRNDADVLLPLIVHDRRKS